MLIEVCDLCGKEVKELNKTEVIIKDHKGVEMGCYGFPMPAKRKYKAVICDNCLKAIKGESKPKPPESGSIATKE